jgi:anti-sigma factor RsiW
MTNPVNCERVSAALLSYADGRATSDEQRIVEAHAADCADCRARIEEFRQLFGVLGELPAVQPSPSFDAVVRQRIAAEPKESWFQWLMPAPRLAFSLALLLVLSVGIVKYSPTSPEPSAAKQSEQDFQAIQDLGVLENYDVLKNFDALSELPAATPASTTSQPQQDQENEN